MSSGARAKARRSGGSLVGQTDLFGCRSLAPPRPRACDSAIRPGLAKVACGAGDTGWLVLFAIDAILKFYLTFPRLCCIILHTESPRLSLGKTVGAFWVSEWNTN